MLHLSNMRKSNHYKQILINDEMKQYGVKYQFQGTRAEQDFFCFCWTQNTMMSCSMWFQGSRSKFSSGGEGGLKKDA